MWEMWERAMPANKAQTDLSLSILEMSARISQVL
jgi:hypothetical protein